jgi:hypothetical protein
MRVTLLQPPEHQDTGPPRYARRYQGATDNNKHSVFVTETTLPDFGTTLLPEAMTP